jgi:hypothetical protein
MDSLDSGHNKHVKTTIFLNQTKLPIEDWQIALCNKLNHLNGKIPLTGSIYLLRTLKSNVKTNFSPLPINE